MIVPMKHLTVLCTSADRESTLTRLRDLGVVHVTREEGAAPEGGDLAAAEAALAAAKKAMEIAKAAAPTQGKADVAALSPEAVLERQAAMESLRQDIAALEKKTALYSRFGDFDPAEATSLAASGIAVTLFKTKAGAAPKADGGAIVKILSEDAEEKALYGAIVGAPAPDDAGIEVIPLPESSLSAMKSALADKRKALEEAIAELDALVGSDNAKKALAQAVAERESARDLAAAAAKMGDGDGIAWLTGYCPDDALDSVRAAAKKNGWGVAARPPHEDENPPTLLRPPRIFRPISLVFKMLDISPGYREVDLSAVFYGFFTIFFAMLVGDFGYGALMLIATILLRCKFRKAPASPFILFGVFSVATCVWGVLSCNYFGAHPAALDFGISRWLNDPSYTNIMQLCFVLGAIHLTVARLWSAGMLWPDTKALAEIGWAGIIWTMYCTSCTVVIPTFAFPRFMFAVAPVSILLVFLFTLHRDELKTEGMNLMVMPLNIISCLGDIISYVRLFAVGLASVKVAENFNSMALDMNLPLYVKIPVVVAILLFGHGLNIAMGALSILVHAVRLNTLEFSNHKGISWSGMAYAPLKKNG